MIIFVRANLYENEFKSADYDQSAISMIGYLLKKGVYSDWLYAFISSLKPAVSIYMRKIQQYFLILYLEIFT